MIKTQVIRMEELIIPGEMRPHPRPKINRKTGVAFYPGDYTQFKKEITLQLMRQWKTRYPAGCQSEPLDGPLDIRILFSFEKPKSRVKKKTAGHRIPKFRTRSDLDNLIKTVLDALQSARIIANDNLVYRLQAEQWFGAPEELPHTSIMIAKIQASVWI